MKLKLLIAFFSMIFFRASANALDVSTLTYDLLIKGSVLEHTLEIPGIVTFNSGGGDSISLDVNSYDASVWPIGSVQPMIKMFEQYTGVEIITHQCLRKTHDRADCYGSYVHNNSGNASLNSPLHLRLNKQVEKKTKWCLQYINYHGIPVSQCMLDTTRQPCVFKTSPPSIFAIADASSENESTASVNITWSCPQKERPHIEIIGQQYSDDVTTIMQYEDITDQEGRLIARYRVKLKGISGGYPTAFNASGSINTQVFIKGVMPGEGLTSFIMRINLP